MGSEADGKRAAPAGWLFLAQAEVPEQWRDRATDVSLVPLLATEVSELFDGRALRPDASAQDIQLVRLVAQGLSAPDIARKTGTATRTVHRRLARLRARFEVDTTTQLAAEFARRGFS